MKPILQYIGAIGLVLGGLAIYLIPELPQAFATTSTISITGINAPDMTHLNAAFLPMFLPLIIAGLFGGFTLYMKYHGDFTVTLMLIGMTLGSLIGMLNAYSATGGNITIAETAVSAVLTLIWVWQGSNQGSGGGGPDG